MKFRTLAVVLFPALLCLAQTKNPGNSNNSATQAQSNASPAAPCCKAMAENKDAKSCCHPDSAAQQAKDSCCSGKDKTGKEPLSCMKDKATSADSAANCCGRDDHKGCCAKAKKSSEQADMDCCSVSGGGHCGMQHHEQGDVAK